MILRILQLGYSFLLVFIAMMLAKVFTSVGVLEFYNNLNLPDITPQNHYFSKIWCFLYTLLIWSFFIILKSPKTYHLQKESHFLYINQLFLQVLWCFSFFYLGQIYTSVWVMIALIITAILMMHTFLQINKWAFILTIPYLIWLLFAFLLNILIAFLN